MALLSFTGNPVTRFYALNGETDTLGSILVYERMSALICDIRREKRRTD